MVAFLVNYFYVILFYCKIIYFARTQVSKIKLIYSTFSAGMSTAPEAILARHCDMRVFGVSLITDMASLDYSEAKAESHDAVLEVGRRSAKTMEKFISAIIEKLSD